MTCLITFCCFFILISSTNAHNIPKTTDDIVIKTAYEYQKSWHERLARPSTKYTEWMLEFEFLVNHHAFYDGEQYLLRGLGIDKENDLVVATLKALDWNVSWRTVQVLRAIESSIRDSETWRPQCRVLETNHPSVRAISGHRAVINIHQGTEHAYTDHQLYVDVRYWHRGFLTWLQSWFSDDCVLQTGGASSPWLMPVIELTLPRHYGPECRPVWQHCGELSWVCPGDAKSPES